MDVFDLSARLTLDKSEYESGLEDAKDKGAGLGTALTTAGKVAGTGILAVGTAVAGLTTGIANATSDLAEYGDNIDKSSQKLGVSSQFYQEWDAVLQHSGTSMDSMTATFKTLSNASQGASKDQQKAFEALGISMEEVSEMSTEELFTNVITGLQGMEESTERTALATDLLGRGAMEMGALLNTSAEDTQAMIDTVNQLGGVLDDTAIKNSAHFEDSLQDLQTALQGAKNGILADFLPSVNSMLDGLVAVFSGDSSGLGQINEGINGFINNLTDALPKVLEVGSSIAESLATAIIDNLPSIIDAGADVVMKLAETIIQNLPQIISTGLEVIVSLAEGIADSLPQLIPTIVDVVLEITENIIDNVDLIIDGAIALIVGLAEGLINSLPKLIEKAPEIVTKLMTAIVENAPKLLTSAFELIVTLGKGLIENIPELLKAIPQIITSVVEKFGEFKEKIKSVGKNIIEGIKQGILDSWDSFKEWIYDKFKGIIDGVKEVFGIHSPSTVFQNIGEMMVAGLENGSDGLFDGTDFGIDASIKTENTGFNSLNMDYEKLGQSVANALAGFSINMDGRSVAQLIANDINYQLGVLNARRV